MDCECKDYLDPKSGIWMRDVDFSYSQRSGLASMPPNLTDESLQVVPMNSRREEYNAELKESIDILESSQPRQGTLDYYIWKAQHERALAILRFDFKWFNKWQHQSENLKCLNTFLPVFTRIDYSFERRTVKCYALDEHDNLRPPKDWYNAYENEVFEWTWLKESELRRLSELILQKETTQIYEARRQFCKAFDPDMFNHEPRTFESDEEYEKKVRS